MQNKIKLKDVIKAIKSRGKSRLRTIMSDFGIYQTIVIIKIFINSHKQTNAKKRKKLKKTLKIFKKTLRLKTENHAVKSDNYNN